MLNLKRSKRVILRAAISRIKDWIASPWMSRLNDEEWFSIRTRRQGLRLYIRNHLLSI